MGRPSSLQKLLTQSQAHSGARWCEVGQLKETAWVLFLRRHLRRHEPDNWKLQRLLCYAKESKHTTIRGQH